MPGTSDLPLDPDLLDRLAAYAAPPRGNRATRTWTIAELLPLFDPAIPVWTIAEQMGVPRATVTYELVRLRRAGFVVTDRPMGAVQSPGSHAIEADLRAGLRDAEVARRHGVTPVRVWQIRHRVGIPVRPTRWSDQERAVLIAHQERPAREVAEMVGRTVRAVDAERSRLIAQGRIAAKIERLRKQG